MEAAQFREAGEKLFALHLNFQSAEPFPVVETKLADATYHLEKMRWAKAGKVANRTTLIYNAGITLSGIPLEASEYMLGSRSALDWIIERYQIRVDGTSHLINDSNEWIGEQDDERALVDLVARVVTVSVETVRLIRDLPNLEVLEADALEPVVTGA